MRDAVIPMVSRLAPFQHAFVQRLSELGIAYRGSPIVEGAGERYLDESMRGGGGIRSRFLLFIDDEPSTREAAARLFAPLSDVVDVRSRHRQATTLVRPDGYVAYTAPVRHGVDALTSAREVLDRQVGSMPGMPVTEFSGGEVRSR